MNAQAFWKKWTRRSSVSQWWRTSDYQLPSSWFNLLFIIWREWQENPTIDDNNNWYEMLTNVYILYHVKQFLVKRVWIFYALKLIFCQNLYSSIPKAATCRKCEQEWSNESIIFFLHEQELIKWIYLSILLLILNHVSVMISCDR